jgi:hypothetical protein
MLRQSGKNGDIHTRSIACRPKRSSRRVAAESRQGGEIRLEELGLGPRILLPLGGIEEPQRVAGHQLRVPVTEKVGVGL